MADLMKTCSIVHHLPIRGHGDQAVSIYFIFIFYKMVVPDPYVQPKVNLMDILVFIEMIFSFLVLLLNFKMKISCKIG